MQSERFASLDGWRGIAACMVALFHVRANGHISELELVKNAHLFVDYFFVLSGFVMAALEEILQQHSVWRGAAFARPAGVVPTGYGSLDHELPGGGWPS